MISHKFKEGDVVKGLTSKSPLQQPLLIVKCDVFRVGESLQYPQYHVIDRKGKRWAYLESSLYDCDPLLAAIFKERVKPE